MDITAEHAEDAEDTKHTGCHYLLMNTSAFSATSAVIHDLYEHHSLRRRLRGRRMNLDRSNGGGSVGRVKTDAVSTDEQTPGLRFPAAIQLRDGETLSRNRLDAAFLGS